MKRCHPLLYVAEEEVGEHWLKNRLSEDEWKWISKKEQAEAWKSSVNHSILYGATLLAALVTETFLFLLQLGDGDIMLVSEIGEVTKPIAGDARLLANETTSLCTANAVNHFRLQFRGVATPPALILLSTDGYANSFRTEAGFLQVGRDVWSIMRSEGIEKVKTSLKGWLDAATRTGSGDDITLVFSAIQMYSRKRSTRANQSNKLLVIYHLSQ